jgi:nucleoside-diphosphate-sugar epimerase
VRILVTGASGFLGRAVVERLAARGDLNLRCFVRPNSNVSGLEEIRNRYPRARLDFVIGNLASPDDARRAVQGVDTIYHLAAGMRGHPATIFVNTVVASKYLLEAIQDKKRRIVLISSLGVYGTSFLETDHLIGEDTELDPHPEKRNVYFHAKIWQERLFRDHAARGRVDLVVLRPGILYGTANPNRGFPARIGILVGSLLIVLGGGSRLPLSHVVNCAEAVVLAGQNVEASGQSYNVIDDNLPSTIEYLRQYKHQVKNIAHIRLPFLLTMLLSRTVEKYHAKTYGQIPAVLTPYESSAMWKGYQFDNHRIKNLGWKQIVPTEEGLRETFAYLRGANGHIHVKRTAQSGDLPGTRSNLGSHPQ